MKKILTYVTLGTVLFPQYLFAGNWFCSGNTSVCGEADLRLSISGLAKIGFFLFLLTFLGFFVVQTLQQFSENGFQSASFYTFLKKKLSTFVLVSVIFVVIINFSDILKSLHVNSEIVKIFNALTGSK